MIGGTANAPPGRSSWRTKARPGTDRRHQHRPWRTVLQSAKGDALQSRVGFTPRAPHAAGVRRRRRHGIAAASTRDEKARGSRRSYKRYPRSGACRSGASRELLVLPHDPPATQASPAGSLHVGDRLVARAADLEEGVAARPEERREGKEGGG